MSKDIRVRYAPSPTGLLHIGNARTALFNYLYARHHGGTFIIRIEDTDRKRHVEDGERSQLENLRWLGMDWNESPETHENYRQSERLELYQKYIDQLLAEGKAYKSYVTEEELAAERERQEAAGETPRYINEYLGMSEEEKAAYVAEREAAGIIPTVRLVVNESGIYKWHDMVKGDIEFEGGNIGGDWVIQKKDGYPTYNFAVVIDDNGKVVCWVTIFLLDNPVTTDIAAFKLDITFDHVMPLVNTRLINYQTNSRDNPCSFTFCNVSCFFFFAHTKVFVDVARCFTSGFLAFTFCC